MVCEDSPQLSLKACPRYATGSGKVLSHSIDGHPHGPYVHTMIVAWIPEDDWSHVLWAAYHQTFLFAGLDAETKDCKLNIAIVAD